MTLLEAIKAHRDKHHNEMDNRRLRQNLSAQALLFGSDIGAGLAGRQLAKGLLESGHQVPLAGGLGPSVKDMAKSVGLDVETQTVASRRPNAVFEPAGWAKLFRGPRPGPHGMITGRGVSTLPAEVAGHEIGHAMSWYGKAGIPGQIISRARIPGMLAAFAGPFIGWAGAAGDKPLLEREKLLDRSSLISGAGVSAVVADEVLASRNAFKVIAKLEPSLRNKVMTTAFKNLVRAGSTYGLAGLGLVLGPQLAKQYYRRQ